MLLRPLSTDIEILFNKFLNEADITIPVQQEHLKKIITQFNAVSGNQKCESLLTASVEISKIIIHEINLDTDSSVSFLLFSICKEISVTPDEIRKNYNTYVAEIVNGLSKIDKLDTTKYTHQADNFIKLLLTISDDLRVILIRLAERLYQMRNTSSIEESHRTRIATETSVLYTSIAHRIGLYNIKTELDDLCMKFFYPEKYAEIKTKLAITRDSLEKYISNFIKPIEEKLKEHCVDSEIFGRVKSIPSIWKKMQAQEVEFEKVYDLFAIRVIINTACENEKAECWKVYSLVTEEYAPNPKRMRDWITVPKSSGYESLHATVIGPEGKWVEVQIRTLRMDEIAEKGFASHWKYKDKDSSEKQTDLFAKIRDALQKPTGLKSSSGKEKKALYTDEIFVFTPKGDLKKFKAGHTVLDFAFEIHSDIGYACTGAVVNEKMVSFRHVLKNGDTIKILTSKNQKPNHSWLDFVKSTKAISKIKQALKAEEYKYADEGKEIIKHKFEYLDIEFTDINIHKLVTFYKCETILDLYQMMGEGKFDATKIKKALLSAEKNETGKIPVVTEETHFSQANFEDSKGDFLTIDNQSIAYAYQYSKCCNPIPGDKIFAFVTVSQGIKIHKTNCKNAKTLIKNYPYRVIEARWRELSENSPLTAFIKITAKGNLNTAYKINSIIKDDLKLNLRSSQIENQAGGMVTFTIALQVNGKDHLGRVIIRLKKIKDVRSVQKVDP
ncbi:MAG: bifunctional (p)ppGpp synthetase/guanosine-3',5'-bis(diphosphate) 3'-pyrophosphohydrolase [Bacteroidetes bacterium]|nr:bifunctional (p)ppGpp synthetase/guanosine-3',5'-bis(diphosphate) 3'-pyrophosphohydrolase [Bacteroidota bacterium]